jgi:predicted ATPase/DNA-binding XRE family transcriptional regulator
MGLPCRSRHTEPPTGVPTVSGRLAWQPACRLAGELAAVSEPAAAVRAVGSWAWAGEGTKGSVAEQAAPGFGRLLRQLRADAGLTQEELAEAASLSPRSISDLERGISLTARRETARLLADALRLAGPQRALFEAAARGRAAAAGMLAVAHGSLIVMPNNFPLPVTTFVGREDDSAGVREALAAARLVTLVGAGGIGKTRLALHAAAELLPSFRDGGWLCELHTADDGDHMARAVLAALRAHPRPGTSLTDSVVEFLRTRRILLVLDTCEHLLGAAATLAADILRSCREVRILATSRQALGVGGEQVYGLRPLSLPEPGASIATAGASDAVSLFVQRASAARSDFVLSSANVAAVGEICRRLDGMPLAIELAAARVAAMRPAEIAGLLDDRFRLLTRGRADAVGRQQTLLATVDWSYALLRRPERHVFDCLGVFAGSFDAAAVASVASARDLQRWDIVDSLMALVDQSMVAEEEGPEQTSRYRLLDTMQAYARQRLAATGELHRMRHRHAAHYAAFAEQAGPELLGPRQLEWQRRIGAELDNLQAAETWAMAADDQARQFAFRITAALAYSATFGRGTVGGWAERALAHVGTCPPALRTTVIAAAAWSAFYAGDLRLAQQRAEDALRQPASSDPNSEGMARALLSRTYALTGQPEHAASIARAAYEQAAEQRNELLAGHLLAMEAVAWTGAQDRAAARQPAMHAVEIARRVRNPALSAMAFYAAAGAVWLEEPQTALTLIEDSLALTRAGAVDSILGFALSLAGAIRIRNNDPRGALAVLQETTMHQVTDGNRLGLGMTLQRAATALAQIGEAGPAAVLAGAVSARFAATTGTADAWLNVEEAQVLARRALGEVAYNAAFRRGAAMVEDEAAEYAVGECRRLAATDHHQGLVQLTHQEREGP